MKDNLTIYKTWAPSGVLWADWVKPVLFAEEFYPDTTSARDIPAVCWIQELKYNTMLILDVPGAAGVEEGLALAKIGYRPVPLYNGVRGPVGCAAAVEVSEIRNMLYRGTEILNSCTLRQDAPPVFLLDSYRFRTLSKEPGKYDNRWCVFPQDMPSVSFLQQHGIQTVMIHTDEIQDDLSHILCRYQEQGMEILISRDGILSKKITVTKPSRFKSISYRFRVAAGLTRNAAGGFGGMIPDPIQVDTGSVHYYGRIG